ncbi:MAG: hypothetical protein VX650_06275, partial [Actinomycetota bacterium]|nr:hypothetical protein [Actinomycetota bacterium]
FFCLGLRLIRDRHFRSSSTTSGQFEMATCRPKDSFPDLPDPVGGSGSVKVQNQIIDPNRLSSGLVITPV